MPHQCTNCGRAFDDGSKEMLSGCPDCGGNKFQFHPSETDAQTEPDSDAEPPDPPEPNSSVARTVGNAAATVRDFVGGSTGPPETGAGASMPDDDPAGTSTTDSSRNRSPSGTTTDSPRTAERSRPGTDSTRNDPVSEVSTEDTAQANARSEIVNPNEIPTGGGWGPTNDSGTDTDGSESTEQLPPSMQESTSESQQQGATAKSPESSDQPAAESSDDRPDLKQLREELNDQFESIKVLSPGHYELNLMELYDREEYIIALQEDGRYTIQVPETWHE